MENKKLLFIGLELNEPIKGSIGSDLLGIVKGFSQHVTLAFMPNDDIIEIYKNLIGKEYSITLNEYAISNTHEGYKVTLPKNLPYYNMSVPHITVATTANAANTPYLFGDKIVVNDGSPVSEPYKREEVKSIIKGKIKFYYI